MLTKAESRGLVLSAILGTEGLHQGSYCMVIVLWHRGGKMVLNLEVDMSAEPAIEGRLVDTACCLRRGGDSPHASRNQCAWGYGSSVSLTQINCFPGT